LQDKGSPQKCVYFADTGIAPYTPAPFSICACHPCAGATLIFSASFQCQCMIPAGNASGHERLDQAHLPEHLGICGRGSWGRGDTAVADMAVALPWTFACLVVVCLAGPNSMPQTSNVPTFETPRPQTPRLQTPEACAQIIHGGAARARYVCILAVIGSHLKMPVQPGSGNFLFF